MKKLIALTLVTVGIAASARAQWIVFEPADGAEDQCGGLEAGLSEEGCQS